MKGENKVFSVQNEKGEITRLMQTTTKKVVKNVLISEVLEGIEIGVPSALTVAKLVEGGMKVESV